MYTAKIENAKGDVLQLSGNETEYQVTSITGLNPPNAQINTTTVVGLDGERYNSARLEMRNIVITMRINGNVEANRQKLYRFFPTKQWCRFYFKNENRDVYIDGYVETVEVALFSKSEKMQVSILCPQPFFKALDGIIDDISKVMPAFTFPFTINYGEPVVISRLDAGKVTNVRNDSETETGMTIEISFRLAMSSVRIWNTETGESFGLSYNFMPGDVVRIDTNKGQKSVTLVRSATSTNLFTAIQAGSVFFQLEMGDNYFTYKADNDGVNDGYVTILFIHNTVYRGV